MRGQRLQCIVLSFCHNIMSFSPLMSHHVITMCRINCVIYYCVLYCRHDFLVFHYLDKPAKNITKNNYEDKVGISKDITKLLEGQCVQSFCVVVTLLLVPMLVAGGAVQNTEQVHKYDAEIHPPL